MFRWIAQVEVGPLDFHLDHLGYMSQHSFHLEIKNVGSAIAHWRFVPKIDELQVSATWCSVTPTLGMLSPDEVLRMCG